MEDAPVLFHYQVTNNDLFHRISPIQRFVESASEHNV